jgi:hypothetical protein
MIQHLHDSQLGTDDAETINDWIANGKDKRPRFELTINWPQSRKPDVNSFEIAQFEPAAEESVVKEYQR